MKESFEILDNDIPSPESLEDRVLNLEEENSFLKSKLEEIEGQKSKLEEIAIELSAKLESQDKDFDKEVITNLLKEIGDLRFEKKILEIEKVTDDLTGLKKRNFFEELVSDRLGMIEKTRGEEMPERRKEDKGFEDLSFVLCDLDHFKDINDTFGHEIGDEVLRKVSETLKTSVRGGDIVCRWGGEEIAIALLGADKKGAVDKTEKLRELVQSLDFSIPGLKVTMSAGIASSLDDLDFKELYKKADSALYEAKRGGRNKVVAYSDDQN
ncbi:MAG: GGDEF domain-containing protein [Candidatus Paceibacterota bacterium]